MEGVWGCACAFLEGQASWGAHRAPETYGEREEDVNLRQMRVVVSPPWGFYLGHQMMRQQRVLCDVEDPTWGHRQVFVEDWEGKLGGSGEGEGSQWEDICI